MAEKSCDCASPNGVLHDRGCQLYQPSADPLFIPLKTAYYEAFADGSKTVEYRRYGRGWNERTCPVGRPVVLSKGYGKANRLRGRITRFHTSMMDTAAWIDCYGEPGLAACIHIKVQR